MDPVKTGIIGGSGLSEIEDLHVIEEREIATPFGQPSSPLTIGEIGGERVAFLSRHGRGHFIPPTAVNYRANLFAMKTLGVERILSFSAVGSLKEEIRPRDFVICDQLYDRTKQRASTFFDRDIAAHVSFADPFCGRLREWLAASCRTLSIPVHDRGTYVCIEGPQFSTRAESRIYRGFGADVIGMTNIPESKLAREAEICYATVALATDYDVWHESGDVTVDGVLANMKANVANVKRLLVAVLRGLPDTAGCFCRSALAGAIMTAPELVSRRRREELAPLIGKYLK